MWTTNCVTCCGSWSGRTKEGFRAGPVRGNVPSVSDPTHPSGRRKALEGLDPATLMSEGLRSPEPNAGAVPRPEVPGYDLLEKLGEGGMGEVFLARQRSLDRDVALKVVRREGLAQEWFLERLDREARILARLRNPHLVTVHDFVRLADGSAAVVMELVEGGNLRDRLRSHPQGVPVDEALAVAGMAGAALGVAHAQGIVHRDIKPENLLVDGDGRIRVSDFGMALSLAPDSPRLTRTGAAAGTPGYLAPEQVAGGRVDVRTDVYALAVVLYELLTGRLPLGRFEAPRQVRPEIPEAVEAALLRALDPNPLRRPQSVSAFLEELHGRFPDGVVPGAGSGAGAESGAATVEEETAPVPDAGNRRFPPAAGADPQPARPESGPFRPFVSGESGLGRAALDPMEPAEAMRRRRSRRKMVAVLGSAVALGVLVKWLRPGRRLGVGLGDEGSVAWKAVGLPVDPAAAALSGSWSREGDAVVSGGEICLLPLMAELPPAWNLRLVVTRLGGSDSAAVFFRHPAGFGSAELDGWTAHRSGVQAIDGVTTQAAAGFGFELRAGHGHELELSVRPDGVRMSVDGRSTRIYPLTGRRLTVVPPWNWPEGATPPALALGSYRSPMRFSRIRWVAADTGSL